ncbi:MAG: hypothetical protein ACRDRU_06770 [Pseudonocardiaceae bacterium]
MADRRRGLHWHSPAKGDLIVAEGSIVHIAEPVERSRPPRRVGHRAGRSRCAFASPGFVGVGL